MTEEDVEIWSDKAAELIQSPDYRQVAWRHERPQKAIGRHVWLHMQKHYIVSVWKEKEEMRYEEHTKKWERTFCSICFPVI